MVEMSSLCTVEPPACCSPHASVSSASSSPSLISMEVYIAEASLLTNMEQCSSSLDLDHIMDGLRRLAIFEADIQRRLFCHECHDLIAFSKSPEPENAVRLEIAPLAGSDYVENLLVMNCDKKKSNYYHRNREIPEEFVGHVFLTFASSSSCLNIPLLALHTVSAQIVTRLSDP
ncbi:hypothetical protein COOONC_04132 [Cooperia oncophora]